MAIASLGRITGQMLNQNLERSGVNLVIDANLTQFDVSNRRVGINTTTPAYTLDVNGNAHIGNLYILGNTVTSDAGQIKFGSISNINFTGGTSNNVIITDGTGNLSFTNIGSLPDLVAANISIVGVNANLNAYETWANATFVTTAVENELAANVGAYHIWANANLATQTTNINLVNANVTAANATIAALQGNLIPLGSNTSPALRSNAVTLTTSTTVTDAISQLNFVLGKLVPPSPPPFPGSSTLALSTGV